MLTCSMQAGKPKFALKRSRSGSALSGSQSGASRIRSKCAGLQKLSVFTHTHARSMTCAARHVPGNQRLHASFGALLLPSRACQRKPAAHPNYQLFKINWRHHWQQSSHANYIALAELAALRLRLSGSRFAPAVRLPDCRFAQGFVAMAVGPKKNTNVQLVLSHQQEIRITGEVGEVGWEVTVCMAWHGKTR